MGILVCKDSQETQKLHLQLYKAQKSIANGINSINNLLADHLQQKDSKLRSGTPPPFLFFPLGRCEYIPNP